MKKVIQTYFNKDKYLQDRQKELKNILFERFGVYSLEELESSSPSLAAISNPISDFSLVGGGFVSRGKAWQSILSEQINAELDKRLNKEDYEEINEYPLLNIVLDSNYNFIYIVLLEDGTPKKLWQKDGEYRIVDK